MSGERQEEVVVRGVIGTGREFLDQRSIHNAFLGISLDKPISDRHLSLYIQWALVHARHCPVLIDDIEVRYNYMVFKEMNEEDARRLALSRGDKLAVRISGIVASATYTYRRVAYIQQNPEDHRGHAVWLRRASEGYVEDRLLEPLTKGYEEDEMFRHDVDAQVERGLGNRFVVWGSQVSEDIYKLGRERLARFVLEETVVTIGLVQRGYSVELYAGPTIQVVVDLYDPRANKYPKLREELNTKGNYGHVSLGIQRT